MVNLFVLILLCFGLSLTARAADPACDAKCLQARFVSMVDNQSQEALASRQKELASKIRESVRSSLFVGAKTSYSILELSEVEIIPQASTPVSGAGYIFGGGAFSFQEAFFFVRLQDQGSYLCRLKPTLVANRNLDYGERRPEFRNVVAEVNCVLDKTKAFVPEAKPQINSQINFGEEDRAKHVETTAWLFHSWLKKDR